MLVKHEFFNLQQCQIEMDPTMINIKQNMHFSLFEIEPFKHYWATSTTTRYFTTDILLLNSLL